MLARLGVWEIMAIVAIVGLVFGGKKLPELGKTFGATINNFKKAASSEALIDQEKDS